MKDQINTIREALLDARSLLHDGRRQDKALTALAQIEAAVGSQEPMFWVRLRSDGMYEGPIHNAQIERVRAQSGAWSPLFLGAAPVAQQYEAGDMASAAAQGFRDGVASVTQQEPVAEVILCDGKKIIDASMAFFDKYPIGTQLFVAPVAQQPQAEAVPSSALNPDESDSVTLWAEIWRLREAVKGPDGYATWQDAATAERIRRVRAEGKQAEVTKTVATHDDTDLIEQMLEALSSCSGVPHWPALIPTINAARKRLETPQQAESVPTKFKLGDTVRKTKGSQWHGAVVGTYSTSLTPEGYAVESATEKGSVQIYPASALELWEAPPQSEALSDDLRDRLVAIGQAIADQDDRAAQAMIREILAAPQQAEAVPLDMGAMELAESVGLIGPASRTDDFHAAIQRFHDLISMNVSIKAAVHFAQGLPKKGGAA